MTRCPQREESQTMQKTITPHKNNKNKNTKTKPNKTNKQKTKKKH